VSDRPTVGVARCASYEPHDVSGALSSLLDPLGGMPAFVAQGQRVLVKVNLLMRASPERAVTTHPEVVRAVVRAAIAAGASEVTVGDSPGGRVTPGAMTALLEATGIAQVCREEGVRFVSLDEDVVRVPAPGGRLYTSFDIGGAAARTDVLISVSKMKTHGFMQFTGAVKNLFGCIPGLGKAQFHLKVPDRDDFADMLVDLMLACRPALSIMDAVVAMEGDGPSRGTQRHVGVLLASADAVALDVVASSVAGFDPMDVYTNRAAAARGIGPADTDAVRVAGIPWQEVAVPDFVRPARDPSSAVPPALSRWARARAASRPALDRPADCTACGTCADSCPVNAIDLGSGKPEFDLGACIRCYCCQELCPQGAIGLKTPWVARALLREHPSRSG